MKMFKFTRPLDERGVSVVLGAILLLGIGIAVGSLVYSQYVQSTLHSTEAGFMNDVGGTFVKLQSSISAMGVGQWTITNLKMNPSFPFFIPTQGEVGTLSAHSGAASSAFQEISIKIWNSPGSISGSTSGLGKDNDKNYLEANQVVFSEKFPTTLNWFENTVHDDTGTPTPALDLTTSYPSDGTGSIHVSTDAGKGGTTYENAYWERDFSGLMPTYPSLTLQAWFNMNFFTNKINKPTSDASWQIDIENSSQVATAPQTLYAHQENTLISGTNYFSLKTSGPDAAGTNLSVSTENTGRQLWGGFVYPIAGFDTILTSTWNIDYRSWLPTVPPITTDNSPSSTSGGWANGAGAQNDGGGYASTISDNIDNNPASQTYQGYGFNIPAGSTINQVRVRYDAWTTGLAQSITLLPNSAGDQTNLNRSGSYSTNWEASSTDDGDNSYVYNTTGSSTSDLYNLDNRTTQTGIIDNVVVYMKVRQTASGGSASTRIKIGGTTFSGTSQGVNTNYQTFSTTYTTNPAGGNWTWDNINSLQAGVTLSKAAATYVWVVVNYHQLNDNIRVYVSGNGGNSWSSPQDNSLTLSETTYWDNVTVIGWNPENFNGDNFWVKVGAVATGAAGEVRLDWIPVEVTYTVPTAVAQASVDILIRKSDNTVRQTLATNVAVANLATIENTLQASYSFSGYPISDNTDYLEVDYYCNVTSPGPSGTAYLKIDNSSLSNNLQTRVENVVFGYAIRSWNTPIYFETTENSTNGWQENYSLINGRIETIRAQMYAEVTAASAGGTIASLDVWADDISLLAGPPFWDNLLIGSQQIISPNDVDNVVITIGFSSQDSGSRDNLYILENNGKDNFLNSPNLEQLEENVLGANTKFYWSGTSDNKLVLDIKDNPGKYIDNNGIIWLNLLAENDNSPFRLLFDYINFQVNYKPGYENNAFIQGYYGSSGALTFQMSLYSFPNQSYIYDDGAVILVQENKSVMVSPPIPPLVDVKEIPGDPNSIEVDVNHVALTGVSPPPITKTGYASVGAYLENDITVIKGQENSGPMIFDIKIPYSSITANAWSNYLNDRATFFNSENFFSANFTASCTQEENWIYLRISTSTSANIFYYEYAKKINFVLS
jgi:hypothetical protein